MRVYENFIRELLRNNIIKNYSAEKAVIRNYYNNEFKSKPQYSFQAFSTNLWRYWYISGFKKGYIYFDQRWIAYLLKLEKAENTLKEYQFSENNVCDKNGCQLCLVKFTDENLFKIHRDSLKHKIRVKYLTDKSIFTYSTDLNLAVMEVNNIVYTGIDCTRMTFEQKTNINATLHLINNLNIEIEIIEVIQINPHISDLTMHAKFNKGTTLKLAEYVVVVLNGYFENSAYFAYSIVIAAKYRNKKDVQYFLKEIEMEVISEYSDIKSEVAVSNVNDFKYSYSFDDMIIPGKRPDMHISYYKEKFPLQLYLIPESLKTKLQELVKIYPSFIDRSPINYTTSFFVNEYANILQINPVMNQDNYCNLLETLINIEENQIQVDVRSFDTMSKLNYIQENIFQLEVPGLAEARPSLLLNDSVYVKERNTDTCKYQGIVNRVLENSVHLGFNSRFSNIFVHNKIFHIEFGYNRRPIRVAKQALLLVREQKIVSYFYPNKEPKSIKEQTVKRIKYFNSELNEEQKRAVKNILEIESVPYLIFGPPGTGKTVTVVETIFQIWRDKPETKILVCAPSNAATNEITLRLLDNIPSTDIFRLIGNMYGQATKLGKLENVVNIEKDGSFYMPSMEDILKHRILLTTLVTAARIVNGGVPDGHYSYVFIDESGYATEAESLIPIAGILSNSTNMGKVVGQIVLAGDPKQLGPVVHSSFVKYCGYGKSMLERLIDTCKIYARNENKAIPYDQKYVTKLVKNYRSHKCILKIPNELFYYNELIPEGSDLSNTFTEWEHLKAPGFPVIFHHVLGEDKRQNNSPSFFNIQEIEEVISYISKLVGNRVKGMQITQEHIGVITPYRKQVEMVHKVCERKQWNSILVGSVEQFQGKEKLVIIISTVRSRNTNKFEEVDRRCQLGFLRNPKRFNVAVTRAQALLIVVGNAHALKTDRYWLRFIEYCANNKSVAGKAFNLSDDEYLNEEIP